MDDHAIDLRIFRLISHVLNDLAHDWTVAEMTADFDLSIPHLRKLFRHEIGLPPMIWLHDQRLDKFAELLLNTYHPIKVIGVKVGLTNQTHLTRDFKIKFGFTPTGYRKHHAAIEQLQVQLDKSKLKNGQE